MQAILKNLFGASHLETDPGDGQITLQEFMEGATRLRGGAKALDIWRLETKVGNRKKNGWKCNWLKTITVGQGIL